MKAAGRAERDAEALRLFLSGHNFREIGLLLGFTARRANQIVQGQLAEAAAEKRRALFSEQALAIHQERTERLFQQQWERAEQGDQQAAALCDRILERNAKLYGLVEKITPARPVAAADVDDEGPQDELARVRAARTAG